MSSDEITIPTEILHNIFHLLCDAPIAFHDLKNESHFHEFPWAVGQVCRHWRGAFVSHTHLWTSFALKPGDFNAAYFVEMNRRAAMYLERSREQPLTIVVFTPCSGTQKFPKTVWRMLLSCLKRWKKADLVLGNGAAQDELFRCRGYMSSLESLKMSITNYFAAPKNFSAFEVAPHLTELDLDHRGYTATWQFPWAQLTKLKITASCSEFRHSYSNNLWGVLFQLENIEELHIITTFDYAPLLSHLPIIHLPGLRLLEIPLPSAKMFSWFTAPLLEHLHIRSINNSIYRQHNEPYERELTSLIQRSSCHIRRLVLENCRADEMRIMMKVLASVEELSIIYLSSFTINQDVTGLDGCIYLPKLQVLQVTCTIDYGMNPVTALENATTVFSRLLEARGKGLSLASHDIVPLEKFVLRLNFLGQGKWSDKVLELVHGWPSFAQVYVNDSVLERLVPPL
ncbi:hypothetical protein F5887DRAFT_1199379 [Amanita rubescens]|nr:hypothetical protein F5887DRAFT_1199379 [Amanita rubescens]